MAVKVAVAQGALAVLDELVARLQDEVDFVTGPVDTPQEVAQLTAGAAALVVSLHRLDEAQIGAMADTVQIIGRAGVGLDSIDLEAAERHGIAVVYQPTYATAEVATHAVSMLLSLHRRLPQADAAVRSGWGGAADIGRVWSLSDASVGVLGCGRIGRAVVDRLLPFVREVRVFDPMVSDGVPGARLVAGLDELLDDVDALSLHLPLNHETRHLIGREQMLRMRSGSVLVNVSRGGLIDEQELAVMLSEGHIAGAGLDVFETEPLPDSSPLRSAPNLLLSPHVAWYSDTASSRLCEWTVADVVCYANGQNVKHGRLAVAPAVRRVAATGS